MKHRSCFPALILTAAFGLPALAAGPVVGGPTTAGVGSGESGQVATGWSVKKALLGKAIYNEAGQKVGNVEDIIIAPDKSVSYIIVGAGGFIGVGRHDVAVPMSKIHDQAGKLVMSGATADMIKALPEFDYAKDNASDIAARKDFVAAAENDINRGKAKLFELQKKADMASAETKDKLKEQIATLQLDLKAAEAKLTELKDAAANRWREFEVSVKATLARLRKTVDAAPD